MYVAEDSTAHESDYLSTDNLRLNIAPIAITLPTSTEQVSAVVSVGVDHALSVTARSGGVGIFSICHAVKRDADLTNSTVTLAMESEEPTVL